MIFLWKRSRRSRRRAIAVSLGDLPRRLVLSYSSEFLMQLLTAVLLRRILLAIKLTLCFFFFFFRESTSFITKFVMCFIFISLAVYAFEC